MSKVLFQVGSIFLARNLKRLFFEKKNAIMQTHDTSCESIVARLEPFTPISKAKMKIGSSAMFMTAPTSTEAIDFFLGADIGGRGSTLTTREDGDYRLWTVTAPDGNKTVVRINKKDANKY